MIVQYGSRYFKKGSFVFASLRLRMRPSPHPEGAKHPKDLIMTDCG